MQQAIVIAVAPQRSAFAVETSSGLCAVFCQHSGPPVRAGDVLQGEVLARGARRLSHEDGTVGAVGDSGPVSRAVALALLEEAGASGNGR
ncbi:hypothetical protein [Pseudorhodoferax sp. Leaf274]|uniref:hypothetical protein n=1 Tax=Pseudorhodoferax sp. Leaf274 TaxID=1736318 RepID=UPI000703BC7D|nr:hypothetical protein [Pseudorhodoferax sp. Leaf274]KQP49833.1 hypothetical protein ASF44_04465 [Pseudorhodoferax sp. Leaf274]